MQRRVVITGMAAITPLGTGVETYWSGLLAGRSGIGPITAFDASDLPVRIAGQVPDFEPTNYLDRKEARRLDRFSQFSLAGAKMALEDARFDSERVDRDRVSVIIGSGIGGMQTLTDQFRTLFERGPGRVSPFFIPMMIANMAAGQISIYYGFRGSSSCVVTACASANNAIGDAMRLIQRGEADAVVTGGTEAALVPIAFAGFSVMKALSERNDEPERACRPFDRDRDGFVMGEGAGILVLEELGHAVRRGAPIRGELIGYGSTSDAHHITEPSPGGSGGARAMRLAIQDAGIDPSEIDYINAHGTSTPKGDIGETEAIKAVLGPHARRVAISSTKSMTGHLLGATGAIELIACVKAIETGRIPPTINLEHPDPECDLDYTPNVAQAHRVDTALSNSFGFGGHNATLIVRRHDG